jgi:hypothetical protein
MGANAPQGALESGMKTASQSPQTKVNIKKRIQAPAASLSGPDGGVKSGTLGGSQSKSLVWPVWRMI